MSEPNAASSACWCIACDDQRRQGAADLGDWMLAMRSAFIVCPTCGNKRCPRASHHDHPCSGSNEPGQIGSAYGYPETPRNAPERS